MPELVLIHPPVSLPTEPPVGLSLLAAALRHQGVDLALVDANIEALDHLWSNAPAGAASTAAQQRALRHCRRALEQLRSPAGYVNRDRHHAAVGALRRVLGLQPGVDLAAYHDPGLSPLASADLRRAAERHAHSPFAAYFAELARRVAGLGARVVGLSINYLDQALPALALAGALRARLPRLQIVAGGGLVRCWQGRLGPDGLAPLIDELVFGDGTAPLLRRLGREVAEPLPAAPLPDYADAPWSLYLAPERVVPLSASRGCCWSRCRYCPEAALGEPFTRPLGGGLNTALHRLCERHGARTVHLTDSAIAPQDLRQLAALDRGLLWYGFTRFHRALADEELCRELRRGGCRMLQLGLESGSPRVLQRLNKGIDLDLASRALRALHRAGIASFVYVMLGTPGETRGDAEQTLSFLAQHADQIRFLNVSLLNLPRETPAEVGLETWPLRGDGDLSLYLGFSGQGGWERRDARRFAERELARHPRVAPLLRRTPHVLGANHAAFFDGVA